jgi:hypothetical protein
MALIIPIAAIPARTAEKVNAGREKFSAITDRPVSENVEIYINGYSTAKDLEQLQSILTDSGPDALLKRLGKMKSLGRIERTGTISFYDFKLIISKSTPTGREIYAVADRPIRFIEFYDNTQSIDYPFGILELKLKRNKDGREVGVGSLVFAAKIKGLTGDKFKIEDYSFAPINLLGVRQLGSVRT